MSRDRRSRRTRNKSRDLESRRRSRRRSHGRRKGRSGSERRARSPRLVSRRSRRHRYKVRDEEKPLSDLTLRNDQPLPSTILGGEVQQQPQQSLPDSTATTNLHMVPPSTVNHDSNQKSINEIYSKALEGSARQNTGGSADRLKTVVKRVRRTAPNLSSNYNSFTIATQKVDGKMVHSVLVTTTENIPKKLHFDGSKNVLGNKNVLDNWEIQKICKNIQNGIKFGNCPRETIGFIKNTNATPNTINDGVVFKTKDDIKLNSREMLLAKMHSLQNKYCIS